MMMMSPNAAFKTMEEDDDDIVVPDPITSADATLYAASTDLQEEKKQEDDDRGWLKTIDSWTCYECHVDELTSKTAVTLLPCGHVLCLHCMIDRQATLRNHESSSNGVSGAFTCYCNQVVTSHSYEKQRRRSGPATTREVIMKSLSPQPKMRLHHDEITFIYDSTTAMDDDANMKKDCETKKKSNNSVLNLLCHMMKKIDHFFHAPIGRNGCYIGGYMRILFATIFLYDRILMHYQYDFYYHPNTGVLSQLPNSNSVSSIENLHTLSLFTWLPRITYIDDATLVWILHITGIVQGVLLLLGIMPKFQAICIYLNIVSFQHRGTNMMYDKQDVLCIALSFYMCFLPLNYVSLPQYLWQKNRRVEEDESDDEKFQQPIWPFRFFQLQMMFVFWGAGFGKLLHGIGDDEHNYPTSGIWRRGIAMYYVVHEEDFFGGLFAPDFLYNTKFALEILTYASLVLECTCWFFIWPTTTRKFFLYNMILFHLGIDLAMNIHTFQWYSILGWLAFLVVPLDVELNLEDGSSSPPPSSTISSKPKGLSWWSSFKRLITTCCMLSYIVSYTADTFPATYFYNCLPRLFYPAIAKVDNLQNTVSKFTRKYFLLGYLGIEQEYWDMYGTVDPRQTRIVAKVTFTNGKSTYWSQPQWTLLDVWTKKMIYRQVRKMESTAQWKDERFILTPNTHLLLFPLYFIITIGLVFQINESALG